MLGLEAFLSQTQVQQPAVAGFLKELMLDNFQNVLEINCLRSKGGEESYWPPHFMLCPRRCENPIGSISHGTTLALLNKASMRDDQRCLHSSADDTLISSCLIVTYCGCCMPDLLSLYSYYLFGWLIAHIFWLLHLFVYDNLICSQLNQLTFLQCNWIGKNVSYIFLCYSLESHNCMIYVCVYFVSLIQETYTKR